MPVFDCITTCTVAKSNDRGEDYKSSASATIFFSENEYFSNESLTFTVYFEDADALD